MIRPGLYITTAEAMLGRVGKKEEATKKALPAPVCDIALACVLPPCSILPSRQSLDSQREETHFLQHQSLYLLEFQVKQRHSLR